MLIRKMAENDLDDVIEIEEDIFTSKWSKEDYRNELHTPFGHYYVLEEKEILGYLGMWFMYEQGVITTIGIRRKDWHKGYARELMRYGLERMKEYGCISCSLEVRVSNERAIRLYESYGFQKVAIRKNYYEDHEDAYLMVKEGE